MCIYIGACVFVFTLECETDFVLPFTLECETDIVVPFTLECETDIVVTFTLECETATEVSNKYTDLRLIRSYTNY